MKSFAVVKLNFGWSLVWLGDENTKILVSFWSVLDGGVTFRIFTAGKEARRLMALLQASAKPSLSRLTRCPPAHPCCCPTCLPPWQPATPATDHIGLISTNNCLRDHFSHLKHHFLGHNVNSIHSHKLWLLFTGGWVPCCNSC